MKHSLPYQFWADGGVEVYHTDEIASTEEIVQSEARTYFDFMRWFKLALTQQILNERK